MHLIHPLEHVHLGVQVPRTSLHDRPKNLINISQFLALPLKLKLPSLINLQYLVWQVRIPPIDFLQKPLNLRVVHFLIELVSALLVIKDLQHGGDHLRTVLSVGLEHHAQVLIP